MKNKLPESNAEQAMLSLLKGIYGNDVLSFKLTGSEVVEAMTMAYKIGCEAPKESK